MAEIGAVAGVVAVDVDATAGMVAGIAADIVAGGAEEAAEGLVEGGGSFTIEKVRISSVFNSFGPSYRSVRS